VVRELTKFLEENWIPVIEQDVDGEKSLPRRLERDNPNLARYSAVRRVARTIYMGSAPSQEAAQDHPFSRNRGHRPAASRPRCR
jgi:hypothetical protein